MTFFSGLLDRRFAYSFLLALIWLLLARATLILLTGVWPSLSGMVAADFAGALVLAGLLNLTARSWLRTLLVMAMGAAFYVASVHIGVHGTLFQLALLGKGVDATFLSSSVLNWQLVLLPIYAFAAWLLHCMHRVLVPVAPDGRSGVLTFTLLVVLAYTMTTPSLTLPGNNVVVSVIAQLPGALVTPFREPISEVSREALDDVETTKTAFFHQVVADPETMQPPNVLLIMVEGLSAGYLPSVSEYHGLDPTVTLQQLENTLKEKQFRIYRNMLSMERQTDRGTYAILCGDYPDFKRKATKMLDIAEGRVNISCLPGRLQDRDYHTVYWQAAPLEYMKKDAFMPRIGFSEVTGASVFGPEEDIEGWGPGDNEYFPNVTERLIKLNQRHSPWFATLLNVGTHHPFDVKEEPESEDAPILSLEDAQELDPPEPQQARQQAMQVMEQNLARMLDRLEAEGVLENTLVILTSDESGGFVRQDHESTPLNNNAGMLAIRAPAGDDLARFADRDRLVAQLDIPLTILDAAGLGKKADDMIGHSLLAGDRRDRHLLLADTYTGLKYFIRESGDLLACSELLARCSTWKFEPGRLFGSLQETDADPFLSLKERLALFSQAEVIAPGTSIETED